jgi:hypothetical protein
MAFKIDDPSKLPFYFIVPMLHVTYYGVVMTFEAYLTKMYPSDLRGMMNSCQGIFSTLGGVVYLSICGALNEHNPKSPFMGVAAIDVFTAIAVVVLSSIGLFGEPEAKEQEDLRQKINDLNEKSNNLSNVFKSENDVSYKFE